ncbi:MAG TPA: ribosomal protein S18-alanine N-acetyltransferase [Candidatus Avidehalobacter gallistercoris]|uniref:Ribosomal protein S18-alanine N-acetyltransferase n=1 Tax=Candidatus Avidehalobacter gallistercoris TaxID=2840694 RepID=A0A9D1HK30_9FIRM|nr:ribosomal protein S18-alanine N-acetyltransferase [Candidatus Avidehalobacter gallistercoris]
MSLDGEMLLELCESNAALYLPQLLAIENEAFAEPWSETAYRAEIARPISHVLLLVREETLLGYAGFWQVLDAAEINNVAVARPWRGEGLGYQLLSGLLDMAAILGCCRVNLEVRAGNAAAQALYAKCGFTVNGHRPGYYEDNHEDALLMGCELKKY